MKLYIFEYTAMNFANGLAFPDFFPSSGGIRADVFHVSLFPYSPLRLLGFVLAAAHVPMMAAYKLQLFLGMLLTGLGWWLLLLKITQDERAAFFGLAAFLPGGATFTFHQEQVLMTMLILPWFMLCILQMKRRPLCGPLALVLFCGALTLHYPQIQAAALLLSALAAALVSGRKNIALSMRGAQRAGTTYWAAALLMAAVVLLPMWFVAQGLTGLSSPTRHNPGLGAANYPEYARMNLLQRSSASSADLTNYLSLEPATPDSFSFTVGRPALLAALAGMLFFPLRLAAPVALAALFMTLSMGIFTPLSKLLFLAHLPLIGVFRQWFHFFPFANMALSAAAALAVMLLYSRYCSGSPERQRRFSVIFSACVFLQVADTTYTALRYAALERVNVRPEPLQALMTEKSNNYGPALIMQYLPRTLLASARPERIPDTPTALTSAVICKNGSPSMQDIFRADRQNLSGPLLHISEKEFLEQVPDGKLKPAKDGLTQASLTKTKLILLPFNYDMGWRVTAGKQEKRVYRADLALCAFFAGEENNVLVRPEPSVYPFFALAASAVLALCIAAILALSLRVRFISLFFRKRKGLPFAG